MKIEFLAHYKRRHGRTLKDRMVAGLPRQLHRVAATPGLAALLNLRNRSGLLRRLGERWLGISARRSLPAWRRDTFWRGSGRESAALGPALVPFVSRDEAIEAARTGQKVAVLFIDTFNGGFETENAVAAARVLQAAGYRLHTARKPGGHLCCGRTALASGQSRNVMTLPLDWLAPTTSSISSSSSLNTH